MWLLSTWKLLTICTTSFNINNSAFSPYSVVIYSVRFSNCTVVYHSTICNPDALCVQCEWSVKHRQGRGWDGYPRPISAESRMSLRVRAAVHYTNAPYLSLHYQKDKRGRNLVTLKRELVEITRMPSFYANLVIKCLDFVTVCCLWWADEQQFPLTHTQEYGRYIRNCWPGQIQVIVCLLTPWFFNKDTSMNARNVIGYCVKVWSLLMGTARS